MKITQRQKKAIWNLLNKLNASPSFIKQLYFKILAVFETKKERSLPQHNLYFAWVEWVGTHLPPYKNIHIFDIDTTHKLLKQTQKVTSTAFDNMTEPEFCEYFEAVKSWVAVNVLQCDVETMMASFEETA